MDSSIVAAPKNMDPLRYLRISTIRYFTPGQVIYAPGESAPDIFLIMSGKVKMSRIAPNGREIVIGVYQSDEFFGESALVESCRSGYASALEDTQVMVWTVVQIEALGLANPKLLYALLQMSVERARHFEDRIESFAVDDARRRLARALIKFSLNTNTDIAGGSSRMEPLTHELLSSYIGTSREVVTQFMNQFRRMGCLSYSRKEVLVFHDRMQQLLVQNGITPAAPVILAA